MCYERVVWRKNVFLAKVFSFQVQGNFVTKACLLDFLRQHQVCALFFLTNVTPLNSAPTFLVWHYPPPPPMTRVSDLNLFLEDDSVKTVSLVQTRKLKILGWYIYMLIYLHSTRYYEGVPVILLTPCQLGLFWCFVNYECDNVWLWISRYKKFSQENLFSLGFHVLSFVVASL